MNYELKSKSDRVIFVYKKVEYELKSHPYEPCLYVYLDDEIIKILHNAFDVYQLPEKIKEEKLLACDGKEYDEEAFCKVLIAALEDKHYEMNWTFAAKLAG